MEIFDADAVVVGAGVVGLAAARELARRGRSVTILERNAAIGEETSARNSEVIHAGIYYCGGSLKGRMCVEGKAVLYSYCESRKVAHRRCGKLIVAASADEAPMLEQSIAQAEANGLCDLRMLSRAGALALEPALDVAGAVLSPSTGIVDSHGLMLSLLGEAEDHGAMLALSSPVAGGRVMAQGIELIAGDVALRARTVVNAAGFRAQDVAAAIEGLPAGAVPGRVLVKGNYYTLDGRAPFTRLIYPAPASGGLGVHLTLDLAGAARFGPDVEPLDHADPGRIDYTVDPARAGRFYSAIRRYWPGLPDGALRSGYSGVRPKIGRDFDTDFRVDGPADHGVRGLVNLYGIESPGLTSCLALAVLVADLAEEL